ncbi:hypothetical protein LJ737_03470 [Hymenobacter sp. 15J16-1T3B]|uniref:hypothetical protein n=1 Tax=Hymenobacter sp. 15J16-1T3B TaxID=2886941 RepID=UPI001D12402C|nr:hypothetical protein [Hymenobacter sp. 15J16-1T3B]MCC3156279.1 hypothetical protein [Hymenobacter sp. 15J16-1T3B]
MRKQIYYALAALIFGSAAAPEASYAESLVPATSTATVLHSADASHGSDVSKRKKRKKRRAGRRRR